jgi:hypothetical protein
MRLSYLKRRHDIQTSKQCGRGSAPGSSKLAAASGMEMRHVCDKKDR